jgi:hypothetical protein
MTRQSLTKNDKAIDILKDCIRSNLTDQEIQNKLQKECGYRWNLGTIRKNRRKIGVIRKSGEITASIDIKPSLSVPPPGLSDKNKSEWFIEDFKKCHLFDILKKQFSTEEISTYLEEYGRICCQFEDIVVSEFFQIDKYLKHRILINKQLILAKTLEKEINELSLWIADNPIQDDEPAIKRKERVSIISRLDDKHIVLKQANERYDKLVGEEERMSKSLNATRKDRMDQLAGGKENFFKLVMALQHSEKERSQHGKYAELTRIASDDISREFRKAIKFPDGNIDTIITDHKSVTEEDEL